jgi:hypothetical protein
MTETTMAVDDLWFSAKRGPDGQRQPTKRHGRGKRWRVRYTDDAGRKVERLFERKAEADRFDAGARTDVSGGLYVDDRAGRITVEQYAAGQWLPAQVWRPGTGDSVRGSCDRRDATADDERGAIRGARWGQRSRVWRTLRQICVAVVAAGDCSRWNRVLS